MNLIIDIGNTSVTFASFDKEKLIEKYSTKEKSEYSNEYFSNFFREKFTNKNFNNVYISSVVPDVGNIIKETIVKDLNIEPFFITPNVKTNMKYEVDNPSEIGADIIADLVYAKHKYGYPLLIADLGTATKVLFINKEGNFFSCNFIPGITLSLRSLFSNAALLPDVKLSSTDSVVGKNTIEAINNGIVFSHIGGIERLFDLYEEKFGYECKKVFTGGCAMKIKNLLNKKYILDENLLLEGINYIGENR